ncbi:hypothetical protein [Dokdonella sp.]|uniref:hypothetical protein n=1 Tax=Dokdonella sp. TaxID=2291710 RepID=UPI0025BFFC76|nr:hypothetical protein [Dokdonella sp.]MBX3691631.1 hypothetical protein [Dokdonella sp.]
MKASRQLKLHAQLEATEGELVALLTEALPHTAQHGDTLFFNSAFHPAYVQPHQIGQGNERLLLLAQQSVMLRDELGESSVRSVGQLFLSVCGEAANEANQNRRGPRQLAAWLLGELAPNNSIQRTRYARR